MAFRAHHQHRRSIAGIQIQIHSPEEDITTITNCIEQDTFILSRLIPTVESFVIHSISLFFHFASIPLISYLPKNYLV